MTIIGTTKKGFILEASKDEVEEILDASGFENEPKDKQVIPIAKYIGIERSAKRLLESYDLSKAKSSLEGVLKSMEHITDDIKKGIVSIEEDEE